MNILQVEDDVAWFDRVVKPELEGLKLDSIHHAKNKHDALNIIENNQIDYVILDLSIPNTSDGGSPDIAHGISLAQDIRKNYSGTPILILTGQSTEEAAERLEEDDSFVIFWDGERRPLVKMRKKDKLPRAIEVIKGAAEDLRELNQIEIDAQGLNLNIYERRIVQLFAKENNALGAGVKLFSGGMSSSKVLGVVLYNSQGKEFFYAVAKIDEKEDVDTEVGNYNDFIKRLTVGSFPTYLNQYSAGCGKLKGAFFQLASQYNSDYFSVLKTSDEKALELSRKTKLILDDWIQDKARKNVSIGDVRRRFCSDEKFLKVTDHLEEAGIAYSDFENFKLNINFSVQHSDLHGLNILVSDSNEPLIIDYGDVCNNPSVIDPVTLEMSFFFHPSTRENDLDRSALADSWFDNERYIELIPYPLTAKFLRQWADENKFLPRDYIAVVYAYSIRQLTHSGTDKDLALRFISSAISAYSKT